MKHIKKYFTGILAVILFMQGVQGVLGATEAELQAQIATLLQQVQALQSRIGGVGATNPSAGYTFSRNLKTGSRGADVKKLQEFLKSAGYLKIANTTTTFGPATKAALIKWQRANKIVPASGYFGVLTRTKVNALLRVVPGTSGDATVSYISRPVAAVVGSSVAIKFTSTAARKANIYLCKTKDDCKTVIAANVVVNVGDNTYTWAVPADVVTGAYVIKVEDVARSEWAVYTDVPLTQPVATATSTPPATQPLIAAFALKAPIATMVGEPLKIVFISKNAKNASIALCTDSEHCDITVTAKFAIIDGTNSYIWTVPTALTPRKYIIKIKDADNVASKEFTSDIFAILPTPPAPPAPPTPTINITQPTTVQAGKALEIRFTSTEVSSVNIKLCTSKTECKITIKDNFTVSGTGSSVYSWMVSSSTRPGEYYINISGVGRLPVATTKPTTIDTPTTSVTSEPRELTTTGFIVSQPKATLPGDLLKILFTSKGVNNASIQLCTDTDHCDVTIASKFAITDGVNNYIWSVPTTLTPRKYIIKIKDADNVASKEFTSDIFAILPLPSVAAPSPTAPSVSVFTKAPFTITAAKGTICQTVSNYGAAAATTCPFNLEPIRGLCWTKLPNAVDPFGIKFGSSETKLYDGGAGIVCEYDPNPNILKVDLTCCNP